jgi:hypothetical protein
MREPMQITWSEAGAVYNEVCDVVDGRVDAEELFDIGSALTALALSKMEPAQRGVTYGTLEPYLVDTLGRLDALKRKKLNGHKPKGLA